MNIDNETFLNRFAMERNISESSKINYTYAIKQYTTYTNMNMLDLVELAEKEENDGIRWKNSTLKHHLLGFRTYLFNKYIKSTAKLYFTLITSIYRHYEINIPALPAVSMRNTNENAPVVYADLPDKQLLEKILLSINTRGRALIFFMTSTGCARMETANITIGDYLEATQKYHRADNIYDALETMETMTNIVPTFHIQRQKTKKYYYTFCTPECTNAINIYLRSYDGELKNTDRLFHAKPKYISDYFIKINNNLNLGKQGTFNRFRPHMLRKFHASHLHNDGMSMDIVDSLQGRTKNDVHRAYFLDSTESLKNEYINHMGAVMIEWNYNSLSVKSDEYLQLEQENIEKTIQLETMAERLSNLEKYIFRGIQKTDIANMEQWID